MRYHHQLPPHQGDQPPHPPQPQPPQLPQPLLQELQNMATPLLIYKFNDQFFNWSGGIRLQMIPAPISHEIRCKCHSIAVRQLHARMAPFPDGRGSGLSSGWFLYACHSRSFLIHFRQFGTGTFVPAEGTARIVSCGYGPHSL